MHDPKSVAHEINLWKAGKYGHRVPFITIWHVDPEKKTLGTRHDDSCGWFSPQYTQEELDDIKKLAKNQYTNLFAKQVATKEGQSYAYICYDQDTYGAIYWSWRSIKHHNKKGWQYGDGDTLSAKELAYIYNMATNPVDNFQLGVSQIKNVETFTEFFLLIWRAYRRFTRPWYKHPRWHISHWEIQFHPWQRLKRRYWDKCSVCGKRGFKGSAFSDWEGTKIWHAECNSDFPRPSQNEKP